MHIAKTVVRMANGYLGRISSRDGTNLSPQTRDLARSLGLLALSQWPVVEEWSVNATMRCKVARFGELPMLRGA